MRERENSIVISLTCTRTSNFVQLYFPRETPLLPFAQRKINYFIRPLRRRRLIRTSIESAVFAIALADPRNLIQTETRAGGFVVVSKGEPGRQASKQAHPARQRGHKLRRR